MYVTLEQFLSMSREYQAKVTHLDMIVGLSVQKVFFDNEQDKMMINNINHPNYLDTSSASEHDRVRMQMEKNQMNRFERKWLIGFACDVRHDDWISHWDLVDALTGSLVGKIVWC